MNARAQRIELCNEAATVRLADDLAVILQHGDLLALSGDLGAGKSTFARAVLRAVANDPMLEVPSPTFTLVQTYDLRLTVSHFDLYRLSEPEELTELGLEDVLDEGAALVEWPENAGHALPVDGLWLTFRQAEGPDERIVTIEGSEHFLARLDRSFAIRTFLDAAGHVAATRRHLQGDASSRSYETVGSTRKTFILMNAPAQPDGPPIRDGLSYSRIAHLAEDVRPFVAVARWLRSEGFAAPEILCADLRDGFVLMEDLGRSGVLDADGRPLSERYQLAIDALAALHGRDTPDRLPVEDGVCHLVRRYDRQTMLIEVELLLDWYLEYQQGSKPEDAERQEYLDAWNGAIDLLAGGEESLVLRDYHSPNLIWRAEKQGFDRLGIIDFQDAVIGPAAYDVASLVQDARVTIEPEMSAALVERYVQQSRSRPSFDETTFRRALAIMQAQRASKILGIFVRLDKRDHKPAYLAHLPRMRRYLAAALAHPDLTELRRWYQDRGLMDEVESRLLGAEE